MDANNEKDIEQILDEVEDLLDEDELEEQDDEG